MSSTSLGPLFTAAVHTSPTSLLVARLGRRWKSVCKARLMSSSSSCASTVASGHCQVSVCGDVFMSFLNLSPAPSSAPCSGHGCPSGCSSRLAPAPSPRDLHRPKQRQPHLLMTPRSFLPSPHVLSTEATSRSGTILTALHRLFYQRSHHTERCGRSSMWESIWNNWFRLVVTSALGCSSSHPPPQPRGPSAR